MQQNNKTLAMVRESIFEIDGVVARHRDDFNGDFFQHLHLLTEACQDDLDKREGIAHLIVIVAPLLHSSNFWISYVQLLRVQSFNGTFMC